MAILLLFAAYLIVGIGLDYLLAHYYLSISAGYPFRASILSMIITAITVYVIASVIKSNNIVPFLGYILGNGIGTFLGVRK